MEIQKEQLCFKVSVDMTEVDLAFEKFEKLGDLLEHIQKTMEKVLELSADLPQNTTE